MEGPAPSSCLLVPLSEEHSYGEASLNVRLICSLRAAYEKDISVKKFFFRR